MPARIAALLLLAPLLPAAELQDDLVSRRARLMEKLGPETVFIVKSAPHRVYSLDIDYEYRQDSNFYYLTGIDQPEATLILMPGNQGRKTFLFIAPKDPVREHREGRRLTIIEAKAQSGIDDILTNDLLDTFLQAILSGEPYQRRESRYTDPPPTDFDPFLRHMREGNAKLAVALDQPLQIQGPLNPVLVWANDLRDRFPGLSVRNATHVVYGLRQVKSPYERKLLTRSAEISTEAHLAGMRAAKPGAAEYEVKAAIEQVYRRRGADGPGYPSITGSGPNATTLHYAKADRRMDAGDLMLVDAAASFGYYTVDITRTYPVNGRFTESQKAIYNIVLEAQNEAIQIARPGVTPMQLHGKTVEVIKQGLLRLGLITDPNSDQYRTWYTHGSIHGLGIDVHDVGDRNARMAPGFAFVIEPGIYIRADGLDSLPKTPENLAFSEKVKPAFEKYKNIAVRIEDSFLLTDTGLDRLSSKVPRTVEEIEAFLAKRP